MDWLKKKPQEVLRPETYEEMIEQVWSTIHNGMLRRIDSNALRINAILGIGALLLALNGMMLAVAIVALTRSWG